MQPLADCVALYGDAEIIDYEPSIIKLCGSLYVPVGDAESAAGIYDVARRPVLQANYFAGPDPQMPTHTTHYSYSSVRNEAPAKSYVYGGFMHSHFGHYLLSTFSRLWPYVIGDFDASLMILVHTDEEGAAQFFSRRPWATDLIGAVGLTPERFVTFDTPTRIRELIVPAPSFEEKSYAHRSFATLCNKAGEHLCRDYKKGVDGPAYLSKAKLRVGVRKVVNEDEVSNYLEKRGVHIVFPETLSIAHQAAMWRDRSAVASIVSSGLHASILAPGRNIVAVSDSLAIISSFVLIDKINGASARYLGLEEGHLARELGDPSFGEISRLREPIQVAEGILHALDSFTSKQH